MSFNPVGLIYASLQATTVIFNGLVSWAVFALQCSQMFLLGVIVAHRPLPLNSGFPSRIFAHLSLAWFWALVEVSAWGLTLDVLNFVFTPLAKDVPKEFYLITESGLCITLLLLIRAVPQTTSMLLQSQPASFGGSQLSISNAATAMMAVQRATQTTLAKITRATTGAPKFYRAPEPDASNAKTPPLHQDMNSRVNGRDTRA